jgi:hypothetical protein
MFVEWDGLCDGYQDVIKNVYYTAIAIDDTLRLYMSEPQFWLRLNAAKTRLGYEIAACPGLHGCTC